MSKDFEITHVEDDEYSETWAPIAAGLSEAAPISLPTAEPEDVEYDVVIPGGGVETYQMQGPESVIPKPDVMLQARRKLLQLQMVTKILKRQKRLQMLEERHVNRVAKSRKKRTQQQKSRKRNRGR